MQFNVSQLLQEPIGAVRHYELQDDISAIDLEISILGPLIGAVHMLRTNSSILVTGEMSTAVQVDCNRCLEPIANVVRFEIEESFRPLTEAQSGRYIPPNEFEGAEDDLEDEALIINEQMVLDLTEVVRQSILLALPMYPSCNWEEPTPCPNLTQQFQEVDGLELNPSETNNEEESIDPRWEALLALRDTVKE